MLLCCKNHSSEINLIYCGQQHFSYTNQVVYSQNFREYELMNILKIVRVHFKIIFLAFNEKIFMTILTKNVW